MGVILALATESWGKPLRRTRKAGCWVSGPPLAMSPRAHRWRVAAGRGERRTPWKNPHNCAKSVKPSERMHGKRLLEPLSDNTQRGGGCRFATQPTARHPNARHPDAHPRCMPPMRWLVGQVFGKEQKLPTTLNRPRERVAPQRAAQAAGKPSAKLVRIFPGARAGEALQSGACGRE